MGNYKGGSGNYKSTVLHVKTALVDQTVTGSETLVDSTYLKVPLRPNKTYSGFINLYVVSPAAADMDITFKDITGATFDFFSMMAGGNPASDGTSFGTELLLVADGGNEFIMISFWIKMGATAADLQFQFAQATSNGGNTIVKNGSMIMVFEE